MITFYAEMVVTHWLGFYASNAPLNVPATYTNAALSQLKLVLTVIKSPNF